MTFSPVARYRNFTLNNFKALLEIYPDAARVLSWSDAINDIDERLPVYKRTAYQQACQLGIEDRGVEYYHIHNYLFSLQDEYLEKYLEFWFKIYYAPNPYVNSSDEAVIIYVELLSEILREEGNRIEYNDFYSRYFGGGSDDILLNAIKTFAFPIEYEKDGERDLLFIRPENIELAERELEKIESLFPIGDNKDKTEFFNRFSYENFRGFFNLENELPELAEEQEPGEEQEEREERLAGGENILLYGVPGAGKSYAIKENYCNNEDFAERVVFHPDYTYSDFVGQILPTLNNEGRLEYTFAPGPFTKILKRAWEDPANMYYLIIEELNRGNAPAIFGEVFQLLDRKKEGEYPAEEIGESEYSIYNADIAKAVFGDVEHKVKIPSNLSILSTMNTSDQNVFTLDTAFQRRWNTVHIKNDVLNSTISGEMIEGTNIDWGTFASQVNKMVLQSSEEIAGAEDKRLGAYFVSKEELEATRFSEKVLKYLWDDAFKMDHDVIFKDGLNSLDAVLETYQQSETDKLEAVLRQSFYREMMNAMNEDNDNGEVEANITRSEGEEE